MTERTKRNEKTEIRCNEGNTKSRKTKQQTKRKVKTMAEAIKLKIEVFSLF